MEPSAPTSCIKTHQKRRLSRFGCRNCKLRKVKCDEIRPQCKRCHRYGVTCNFTYGIPDLQPINQDRLTLKSTSTTISPRPLITNALWSSDVSSSFILDQHDQNLFQRFQRRTVYTFGGTKATQPFEKRIYRDAFVCPALMHGILAMAASHDRYLTSPPSSSSQQKPSSLRELHHSSHCAILFNKLLNRPIAEEGKDAIWSIAVILSVLTFSSIRVSSPDEAWPLKSNLTDTADLQWLRFKTNDRAIWTIANPSRPTSVFRAAMRVTALFEENKSSLVVEHISSDLKELCEITETSTVSNNPYFSFVHGLSKVLEIQSDQRLLGQIFSVVTAASKDLVGKLERKDPVALVLLGLWFEIAKGCRWWIEARARYEVVAISTFLGLHHPKHAVLYETLRRNLL